MYTVGLDLKFSKFDLCSNYCGAGQIWCNLREIQRKSTIIQTDHSQPIQTVCKTNKFGFANAYLFWKTHLLFVIFGVKTKFCACIHTDCFLANCFELLNFRPQHISYWIMKYRLVGPVFRFTNVHIFTKNHIKSETPNLDAVNITTFIIKVESNLAWKATNVD